MKSAIIAIVLAAMVLVSGCVSNGTNDATTAARSLPQVQEFLKDHPNADITAVLWDASYLQSNMDKIREECIPAIGNKSYYKVDMEENAFKMTSWVSSDDFKVVCFYKESENTTVATTTTTPATTSTLPENNTNSSGDQGNITTNVSDESRMEECGAKALDYINNNLVQAGTTATLQSVKEEGEVYAVETDYLNQSITVYITKDCGQLFLSSLNTSQPVNTTTTQVSEIPKTSRPSVELYVMSFCPYGVQAEQYLKPVVDILGAKADFKVRFIAMVGGTTVNDIQALHGISEVKEDLRQICIMKYYPDKYWSYLMDIDTNCYPHYRENEVLDVCWRSAAMKLGMNTTGIETCAYGSEGINLLKTDETLTNYHDISGSPTMLINGVRYSGARTTDAYKIAICSAFTTVPAECS